MRAKRDWERVRSPHARFLEGLQAAIAAHPSASGRGGASEQDRAARGARLTVVGSTTDNVIQMPTGRTAQRRRRHTNAAPHRDGSPAA
jgi:hypothetical protein